MNKPYFYIIQHIGTGKKYAGAKWAKNSDPALLLQPGGYMSSSNQIRKIIESDGIEAFRILEIITDFGELCAYEYETEFLTKNQCASSPEWFNGHNNHLFSLGTREYELYMMKTYGVRHASHSKEIRSKSKTTNIAKYGVAYPTSSPQIREKVVKTLQEKYGVDNISQAEGVKKKKSETLLKNYGVDHNSKIEDVKDSKIRRCQEKYGVDNISQAEGVKKKKSETLLKNYGVDHPMKIPEVKKKFSKISKTTRANDPIMTCPHCHKTMKGKGVFNRWHGDNCKLNPRNQFQDWV